MSQAIHRYGGRILDSRGMQREDGVKYVVSYGGGVNSTALVIFIIEHGLPLDYVVFSDTGNEMPETIAYLDTMRKYLDGFGIPLVIVKVRNGDSLSDRCKRRRVIPSEVWRWCTRDMKIIPIHAFYRKLKSHVFQYMGIDYGEAKRMKYPKVDYVTNLYPLVDYVIDRDGCIDIVKSAGLPVPVKSGCYFCPFNNAKRWAEIYEAHPDLYEHAMRIEEGSKHFGKQKPGSGKLHAARACRHHEEQKRDATRCPKRAMRWGMHGIGLASITTKNLLNWLPKTRQ